MKKKIVFGLALLGVGFYTPLLLAATTDSNIETKINFCNRDEGKIFISVAYKPDENANLMARGWWGIEPNKCSELSFPISGDKILVYAQSFSKIYQWLGETKLCINTVDIYNLENAGTISCNESEQEIRPFKEFSIANLRTATGEEIPKIEFKLSDATKVGGGVKFCNDTSEDIFISSAQKRSSDAKTTVNGWLMAKPGKCFEVDRKEEASEILYFATSSNGSHKWRGNVPLCTNDYDGFNHPDAEIMDCSLNKLKMEYFQKEALPTSGEYGHHFKTNEAYVARSMMDICNSRSEENSILVAIAWKDAEFSGQVISKGWSTLKGGECVKDLVIDAEEVWLHVENSDGTLLIEGPLEACVNNINAFKFSKATEMACNGPDELKVKFAAKPIAAGKVRMDIP